MVIKEVLRRRNERHNEEDVMKVVSDYLLGYRLQVPVFYVVESSPTLLMLISFNFCKIFRLKNFAE